MSGKSIHIRGCNFDTENGYRFSDFEDVVASGLSAYSPDGDKGSFESCSEVTSVAVKNCQYGFSTHLLIVALLEHICTLYDPKNSNRELFPVLCSQLSDLKVIPTWAIFDEFQSVRDSFQKALRNLITLAVEKTVQQSISGIKEPFSWQYSVPIRNRSDSLQLLPSNSRYRDEFEEIEVLGEGGFGYVYEVRNKLDGKRYAVKKIKLSNFYPNDCLKVLREVKLLADLENAHIVRYYSAWLEYSFCEDIKRNDSGYSSVPVSGIGGLPYLRPLQLHSSGSLGTLDEKSLHNDSLASDSIVFADSSKEQILHGRFSDSALRRDNVSLNKENSQALVKMDSLIDFSEKHLDLSCPLSNNSMVFLEEQIKAIALYVHIQMELCSGTLKDWIHDRNTDIATLGKKIDMSTNIEIFHQLLLGITYIHGKGVIHRDLKPCNIFLHTCSESNEFTIKIGDFGLARTTNCDTDGITPSKHRNLQDDIAADDCQFVTRGVGTCIYAAPEQMTTNCYTFKADIFSLGIILFELLVPFKTGMERHTLLKELRHSHIPEALIVKWPEMSESIRQMTDVIPKNRPDAASLLNQSYRNDKDMMIKLLRLELAERERTIAHLKELLQTK